MAHDDSPCPDRAALQALLGALGAAQAGDLSVRLPPAPGEPLHDALASAFNALLQRAPRLRSDALAHLGHELRTPLHAMLLLARLLTDNPEGNFTPRQREYSATLLSSAQELMGLLDDLLDLARAESGQLAVDLRDVVVAELLHPLERTFAPVAEHKGLSFHVCLRPGTPPLAHTDPRRVMQVLRNLLSNAFKFTQAGQVRLEAAPAPGGQVALCVTDSGPGISPASQPLVFEAFQQQEGSEARRPGGAGLGLAISRQLALRLGGQLLLRSEPGLGSTFTLTLPAATWCPAPDAGPDSESTSGSPTDR